MLASKPSPDRARRLALVRQLTEALPALEHPKASPLPVPLGCAAMEAALPRGGLGRDTLHEISPASTADWPAALGFVSALVACGLAGAEGLALLVTSAESPSGSSRLYGHGLNGLGLDPGRLVLVETEADRDTLRFGCFGRFRWHLYLERCRNGRTGAWIVEWDHGARGFRLVETMAGDALSPHAVTGQPGARQAG